MLVTLKRKEKRTLILFLMSVITVYTLYFLALMMVISLF